MTTRQGRPLELRPFSGSTLSDVLGYLKRDLARAFADLFAILANPTPVAVTNGSETWSTTNISMETWYDSDTQISLPTGRWLILATGGAEGFWTSGGTNSVAVLVAAIRQADTTVVQSWCGSFGDHTGGATSGYVASFCISNIALQAVVDVGEPKVFKVSLMATAGGGTPTADEIYVFNGRLTAVRL